MICATWGWCFLPCLLWSCWLVATTILDVQSRNGWIFVCFFWCWNCNVPCWIALASSLHCGCLSGSVSLCCKAWEGQTMHSCVGLVLQLLRFWTSFCRCWHMDSFWSMLLVSLSHSVPHQMCEFPFSKQICIFTNLQILIRPTFNMQNAQHFCAAPSSMKLHNKQIWLSCCWKTHTVVILGIRRAWCLVCMFIGEGVVTCNIAGNHWLSASVSSDTRLSELFERSICSLTDFVFLKTIELTVKLPLMTTLH